MTKNLYFLITVVALSFVSTISVTHTFGQKPRGPKMVKAAAPRTVEDFYKILPAKFYPYLEEQSQIKDRTDLIGTYSVAKGYLSFDNNRPSQPHNGQILLLRRMSGVSMLVLSYTDCCTDFLRFVEYENGRWSEADAAPPFDRQKAVEIYRLKTGKTPDDRARVVYELSPTDKSISVKMADTDIYRLEWDGNIYDFAASTE